jgi:hypothetical protein
VIRPSDLNWLLMFHVLGAFLLVGSVLAVTILSLAALRPAERHTVVLLRRLALRTQLAGVIPSLVLLYVFGTWLASREHLDKNTPTWLDIAYPVTDGTVVIGGVLLTLLQWWVLRRARSGALRGWQGRLTSYLAPLVLAALATVVFLMAGKPGS